MHIKGSKTRCSMNDVRMFLHSYQWGGQQFLCSSSSSAAALGPLPLLPLWVWWSLSYQSSFLLLIDIRDREKELSFCCSMGGLCCCWRCRPVKRGDKVKNFHFNFQSSRSISHPAAYSCSWCLSADSIHSSSLLPSLSIVLHIASRNHITPAPELILCHWLLRLRLGGASHKQIRFLKPVHLFYSISTYVHSTN